MITKTLSALAVALSLMVAPVFGQNTTSDNPNLPIRDTTPLEGLDINQVCDTGPSWQARHEQFASDGVEFEGKFDYPDGTFVVLYDIRKTEGYDPAAHTPYIVVGFDKVGCWTGFILGTDEATVATALGYVEAEV